MEKVIIRRESYDIDDTPKSKEDIRKMIERLFTQDEHGNPVTPPDDIRAEASRILAEKNIKIKYK